MTGPQTSSEPIAIIGMSCLFPKAPDVDAFWSNIVGKVDAVTDPPPESWDPGIYYDPDSDKPDRIYCKKGGFLGGLARFDALANKVPPSAVGGEPDQWLALQLARDALMDAGYAELDEQTRRRTGVVLGRGATFSAGTAISVQHSLVVTQTLNILRSLHPEYTEADLEALRDGLRSELPPMGPDVVPGLVPNIVAGRIANRLDLMGPSYTIDAACASSVVAVQNGARDLATGDCDLVLAGGAQIWTPMPMLSVFCQLNALSRRQQIRPFDKDADGTILGEGIGMLVLKRLADAERDGDRIYAVITGIAVTSDGKALGVMAPRLEGQELAVRRAQEAAGISPGSVGLIEAHGTATPVGDLTEIQALTRVFGKRTGRLPSVALGTVKSMISHTVPAAGVAGIIKAALALHFKVLPPTLNCDEPNPAFELEKTPFYINTECRPWIHGGPEPRRAGVSAFGFGGADSHVVLQEYLPAEDLALAAAADPDPSLVVHRAPWDCEVFALHGATRAELVGQVAALKDFVSNLPDPSPVRLEDLAYTMALRAGEPGPIRAAVVADSPDDLHRKLSRLLERLAEAGCDRIQDRSGIFFFADPLAGAGKVAFLFPGEGSQYANMLADLCMHFPEVRRTFDVLDQVYREGGRTTVPSDFIFPRPTFSAAEKEWVQSQLWDMDMAPAAVLTANEALLKLIEGLGVKPDVVVGHSSGEWAALRAAGVFGTSVEQRDRWIAPELLNVYRETIDLDNIPRASLLAIGTDRAQVEEILADAGGEATIAMDNCAHQVVVAVALGSADQVADAARRRSLVVETLDFDRPYHTARFRPYSERLRAALEPLQLERPRVPVISCATGEPFPEDGPSIKQLACDQWVKPVRFRQTVEDLYDRVGVRFFVEVGPRGNLSAFVEDTLRGRKSCVMPANQLRRSGTTQLNHLVGMLFAQGMDLNLKYLFRHRDPNRVDLAATPEVGKPAAALRLQFPEMKLPQDLLERLATRQAPRSRPEATPLGAPAVMEQEDPRDGGLPAPGPGVFPPPSSRPSSDVAHAFLDTMEQFLAVQQRVMTAYLAAGPEAGPDPDRSPAGTVDPPPNGRPEPAHPSSASVVFPRDTPMEEPVVPEAQLPPPEVEAEPPPAPDTTPDGDYATILREIVSERTGYPIETITLTADLEADLGIDSIKRVEIMGTFRQRLKGGSGIEIENLTGERTLQGVLDAVVVHP